MQILESDITNHGLAQHARRAADLFRAGDFDKLAMDYGYAIANGRNPADAMREDLEHALFGSGRADYSAVEFRADPSAGVELLRYGGNELAIAAAYEGIELAQCGERVAVFDLVVFSTSEAGLHVAIEDLYEREFAA